ncbi:hypothetical protein LINGRAHAP2_LOCUS33384 [Linum grandiflorum]
MQRWSPHSRSFVLVTGKSTSSIFIGRRILLRIDHLAHLDHSFSLGVHVPTAPSADLLNWILHDQLSSSQPRFVPI